VPKKNSSPAIKLPTKLHAPLNPKGGDAILVASGWASASPEQSDLRLIVAQAPGMNPGLPVFTLVPRSSYEGKLHAGDVPPAAERRTRAYGGHDLIHSGSMSGEIPGPPSFTLTPVAKGTQETSNPYAETKGKK
jgi:hypothetical protein